MQLDKHILDYFLFQNRNFSHQDIQDIEQACSFICPKDYKKFAITYGGVSFNTSCYNDFLDAKNDNDQGVDFPDFTTASLLTADGKRSLGLSIDKLFGPQEIKTTYLDHTRGPLFDKVTTFFPANLLPIGCCGGSDLFLLASEPDGGKVLFWEQNYDDWGSNSNTDLWNVSDSFEEFIASLKID